MMLRLAIFVVSSLVLQAQEPELRGLVVEFGSGSPINAAEVAISEFVTVDGDESLKPLTTLVTNERGEYAYKPGHPGSFLIEVSKPGYFRSDFTGPEGDMVEIMDFRMTVGKEPSSVWRTELMRPGELSGRVVDKNNQPVAGLKLDLETARNYERVTVTTGADGVFRSPVRPGDYVVHVKPTLGLGPDVISFTEAGFALVDEDVDPLYWPGGVADARNVIPLTVPGGGRTDTGTITIRKIPLRRVHLKASCDGGETWRFSFPFSRIISNARAIETTHPCQKDLLLRGVRPGQTSLAISTRGSVLKWALVSFEVKDENISVPVVLSPAVDIPGRVMAMDGKPLTTSDARVSIAGLDATLPSGNMTYLEEEKDRFLHRGAAWGKHRIDVEVRAKDTYLSEIRYNGQRLPGQVFDPVPGAEMEVILGTPAASITVTTTRDGKPVPASVLVLSLPLPSGDLPSSLERTTLFRLVNPTGGVFTRGNLAPGEYRVVAMPPGGIDLEDFRKRIDRAPSVTLQRGEQKVLNLTLEP